MQMLTSEGVGPDHNMPEQDLPVNVVGSTVFGRYPKTSVEETYNMIISDNWLVPYAGYAKINTISDNGSGRAIYHSSKFEHLILVIDNGIYIVNEDLELNKIGTIDTYTGDVFLAENDANQIAICDKQSIYIYNYSTATLVKAIIDFSPGYITFQDGYFISPDLSKSQWRLSALNNGLMWPADPQNVGVFQTKADNPVAAISMPGRGGNLFIMGNSVTELWNDVGAQLFPYQRTTGFNIDYGCLNPSTIASGENFVIWLGVNEKSGPVIMYSTGGQIEQISTDGINFKLAQLSNPSSAYGFLFKQDGHLFYQLTFNDPKDNFTLTYDFNAQKFFYLCDKNMNYHIAKRIAAFKNTYYFVSFIDGNLYELNSKYTTYDGDEFPRIRICGAIRLPTNNQFIATKLSLLLEQGEITYDYKNNDPTTNVIQPPRVDISLSRDGGVSFGNFVGMQLNNLADRKNKFIVWSLGGANEIIPQFRFYGIDRFVVSNGVMTVMSL
jgi:hypothetical protein